jgi:hypothetical protein
VTGDLKSTSEYRLIASQAFEDAVQEARSLARAQRAKQLRGVRFKEFDGEGAHALSRAYGFAQGVAAVLAELGVEATLPPLYTLRDEAHAAAEQQFIRQIEAGEDPFHE